MFRHGMDTLTPSRRIDAGISRSGANTNQDTCMNSRHQTNTLGFTLMELMIAVSIVAILAAIALPSYQDQVRQARRADGQVALMEIALAQEKFRTHCTHYASTLTGTRHCDTAQAASSALGLSATSPEGYYSLSVSESSTTSFTARAAPIGNQALDDSRGVICAPLTIDQDGQREPRACW